MRVAADTTFPKRSCRESMDACGRNSPFPERARAGLRKAQCPKPFSLAHPKVNAVSAIPGLQSRIAVTPKVPLSSRVEAPVSCRKRYTPVGTRGGHENRRPRRLPDKEL